MINLLENLYHILINLYDGLLDFDISLKSWLVLVKKPYNEFNQVIFWGMLDTQSFLDSEISPTYYDLELHFTADLVE